MGVTGFQWATLILGILGFLLTWTLVIVGATRAVENIKQDTTEKVAVASKALNAKIDALRNEFSREQKSQDHNFGEVGAAMREYISKVEKEMHEIEIWGRDNFVLKDDFVKATDRLEDAIKGLAADIKTDFRNLSNKIDAKH
jgi:hypothetical protein